MSATLAADFEKIASEPPPDETDYSLRAYISRLSEEQLAEYDSNWTDEQVIAWDGNFTSDQNLMLVCCERDVDVKDYRKVLEQFLSFRAAAE